VIIKGWDGYSLHLTLYPSFTLSLFNDMGNHYIKLVGFDSGLAVMGYGDGIYVRGFSDLSYVSELTGVIEDPLNLVNEVDPKFNDMYYYLTTMWRGVGLSTASRDFDYIFIPIFLSKRTSYHVNVLRWSRSIFSMVSSFNDVLEFNFHRISKSPQVIELTHVIRYFINYVRPYVIRGDVEGVKLNLLKIPGVGPKVTYAYILHAMRVTEVAPADTHFTYLARLTGFSGELPRKDLCMRYLCSECPLNCIVGTAGRFFGRALGYLQTIAYVHVKRRCKVGMCTNCLLKRYGICRK